MYISVYFIVVYVLDVRYCLFVCHMDVLTRLGVGADLPRDEFLRRLRLVQDNSCLSSVSECLFNNAVVSGLADGGDVLVGRRKGGGGGKSVREKDADDIWTLVNVIRNRHGSFCAMGSGLGPP